MGKIKLYDIAKEFDMSSKDILAIAVKLNIDAKSHLSSVSDEDAERIRKEAKNTNKTKQNNVKKDSKKLADSKGATPVIIRREVIVEDTTKKSAIPEKKEERKSNNVGFVERKNKDFNIVYRNKPSKPMTFDELFGKKKEEKFKQILELIEIIKVQFQKYSELKDGKTELEDKIKKLQVIIKEQENKKIASENAQKLEAEWEKLSTEVLEKEKEFFREQAGILAEKLKENEPSHECVRLHHPKLAIKSKSVLTKEELDNLKEKEEKNRKILTDATNKVTEINSKIETLNKEFGEKPYVELYNKKYAEISEKLEKAYNQLNDNYKQIMLKDIVIESFEYDIFKEKITNKISKEREEFLKLQTQQEENKKQIDELLQKQEKAQNDYQNTLKELGFENEEQYKKSVLNNSQIEIFSKEIEKYKLISKMNESLMSRLKVLTKPYTKAKFGRTSISIRCKILLNLM